MKITVDLLVGLKGVDLYASTAQLTLVNKMGYGGKLIGIKRFDFFKFDIETSAAPEAAIANLKRVLDRQSTFYNRNKHLYSLTCNWGENSHREGVSRADLERRWTSELAKSLQNNIDTDLDGKNRSKRLF